MSSVQHATIAGEALNPEVFKQFKSLTGLEVMEGFGQTETTCLIGNLFGNEYKLGSMGKPVPLYDIHILDPDGNEVPDEEFNTKDFDMNKFIDSLLSDSLCPNPKPSKKRDNDIGYGY